MGGNKLNLGQRKKTMRARKSQSWRQSVRKSLIGLLCFLAAWVVAPTPGAAQTGINIYIYSNGSVQDEAGGTTRACPGTFIQVTVLDGYSTGYGNAIPEGCGDFTVNGNILDFVESMDTDYLTYWEGTFVMPASGNVTINAQDNCENYGTQTVTNMANTPILTNIMCDWAGTVLSNGTLIPTNIMFCPVGSSITPPTASGIVISNGMVTTTVYYFCTSPGNKHHCVLYSQRTCLFHLVE